MQNKLIKDNISDLDSEVKVNLGIYNFINSLPINLPLELSNFNNLKLHAGSPNEINKLLINSELEIGPISTFEYLKNKEKFILLNDLSISSQKEVGSVILFSKLSLKELGGKNIAVTHTSSTSVNLLKLLIKEISGNTVNLTLHYNEKSVSSLLSIYDAALFIGDPALVNTENNKDNKSINIYDLANLWYEKYLLPMVFCVWVAQKEWGTNNPEKLNQINNTLINCKKLGLTKYFENVISKSSEISNIQREILLNYFQNQLSYNFNDIEKQSLEQFYCNLKENNLL